MIFIYLLFLSVFTVFFISFFTQLYTVYHILTLTVIFSLTIMLLIVFLSCFVLTLQISPSNVTVLSHLPNSTFHFPSTGTSYFLSPPHSHLLFYRRYHPHTHTWHILLSLFIILFYLVTSISILDLIILPNSSSVP